MSSTPLAFAARGGQVMPSHCPHPHCTLFPPHEQLLVAAVGGAVMVVVLRCCLLSLSSSVTIVVVVVVGGVVVSHCHHVYHCHCCHVYCCHCCHACPPPHLIPPSSLLLSHCFPFPLVSSPHHCLSLSYPPHTSLICLIPPSCFISPPHPCRPYSTHNPPHKQLLMRLGAGGVLS
jgi:hypothetical protein